jgi:4-amino-4-deoxy-L-arabinose transferase-like glycosyltransferase
MTRTQRNPVDSWFVEQMQRPVVIFWVALIVRVGYVTLTNAYHVKTLDDHSYFGWEMGRIARALVEGRGYADPFDGQSGPTAWNAPLYPLWMALIFRMTGVYTAMSAWILLSVNSLFSALTVFLVYAIARRCFNTRVAMWSGWAWALFTPFMQFSVRWIWETSLSGFLFMCIVLLALKMRRVGEVTAAGARDAGVVAPTTGQWVGFALMWGVVAMLNPSVLIVLPAVGIWILCGVKDVWPQMGKATLAGVIFFACLVPWTVRNEIMFHHFVPLRGDFGAEMYYANGPGSDGLTMVYRHPFANRQEWERYRDMGEVAFSAWRGQIANATIKADPAHFAVDCLKRVDYFWFGLPHELEQKPSGKFWDWLRVFIYSFVSVAGWLGLVWALRERIPGAWLFFWAFVLLPLIPYVVYVHARFRYPIDPILTMLAVNLFLSTSKRVKRGSGRQMAA